MRLGYLGPPGTFSEEALQASPLATGADLVPFASIHETVMAVDVGAVDRALVPIENALEGGVTATLDALAGDARAVAIVGEAVLAIRNCLIAREALALDDIAVVVSHPQPLAQCARFLRSELPGAEVRTSTSTAEAVRVVAGADEPWAALGPRSAARRYGCAVLREGVDDDPDNATRFVWLGRPGSEPVGDERAGPWKTSVIFAGAGDAQPGLPRRQPHEDRVAPAPRAARPLPLPRRHGGPLGRGRRGGCGRRPARALRGGSRARNLPGRVTSPPVTCTTLPAQNRHGEGDTTRPIGVRAGH
jgi:prephenate dehydratase